MAATNPIPPGYHTVTPHLIVNGASDAVEFYQAAFGATENSRMVGSGGKLMHAEIQIGDSKIMLADEFPDSGKQGPAAIGGSPVTMHLYVEDVDAVFERAVAAGAAVTMALEDMFWGDRYGTLVDPFGHHWALASRKEELSAEEILARAPTIEL